MVEPLGRLRERVPLLSDPEPPSPVTVWSAFRFLLWRGRLTVPMSLGLVAVYAVLGHAALAAVVVSAIVALYAAAFVGVAGAFGEWGYAVAGGICVVAPLVCGWWLLRDWGEVGALLFGMLAVAALSGGYAGYATTGRLRRGPFVE